jgi:hypothetical protein
MTSDRDDALPQLSSIPSLPEPNLPEGLSDSKAALEESSLALGVDLEAQKARNDLNRLLRENRIQSWLHCVILGFIVVVGSMVIAGSVTMGWHYLTPEWLHYLASDQIMEIKSLLLSGTIGGVVANIGRKHLIA